MLASVIISLTVSLILSQEDADQSQNTFHHLIIISYMYVYVYIHIIGYLPYTLYVCLYCEAYSDIYQVSQSSYIKYLYARGNIQIINE